MRDEKEERSKQGQTNNKAKQHSTPKAVTFPKKNELPWVGLETTTLYTLDTYVQVLTEQEHRGGVCSTVGVGVSCRTHWQPVSNARPEFRSPNTL